jgi:uncharacterized RDD family membrane protein YckC
MKCPRCGYLGFEDLDRCRHCGYDFPLAAAADVTPPIPAAGETASLSAFSDDLPLFGPPIPDDAPLIARPSPPRAPLSVRRATPEVRRATPPLRTPLLDLDPPAADVSPAVTPSPSGEDPGAFGQASLEDADIRARLAACAIDVLVLLAIDAAIIYLTLQIAGLGLSDIGLLPLGPLGAFLLAQNGAYLVAFTAGGQTMGKMAAGIKVVAVESRGTLNLGRALARQCLWAVLAAPAGLGLLPAILSRDRRGLHDRLAGTRVVRAL